MWHSLAAMPEGDTIFKVARFMHAALQQQTLQHVELLQARASHLCRAPVQRVTAVGKHLLICWPQHVLRVHLGLYGSWHCYQHNEVWRRPRQQAALSLRTRREVFVCFNAKEVEQLTPHNLGASQVGHLGPDLLQPSTVLAQVVQRVLAQPPATPAVDILLDQHISCGIGNVYKNELLFLQHVHPLCPRQQLDATRWQQLFELAQQLLQANLGGWRRTTTYDARRGDLGPGVRRLYVYGQRTCTHCAQTLCYALLGKQRRSTYWCATCQVLPPVL